MTSNSHTEKDVAEIAKKLTKAQRALLMEEQPWSSQSYGPGQKLEALGLLIRRELGFGTIVRHTSRGTAVRNHLISTPNMPKGEEA